MVKIRAKNRGLTFIELIVVVAIMGIISTVVLFRQAKFSSDILITDMAYQIALAIRQAEVFGLSSKKSDTGVDSTTFRAGFAVLFTPSLATGGQSDNGASAFAMFNDMPTYSSLTAGTDSVFNYFYDPGIDVLMDPYPIKLTQGQKIRGYCGHHVSGSWQCWSYADAAQASSQKVLTITFVKPNPEAHIRMGTAGTSESYTFSNDNYDEAKIVVESGLGDKCRVVGVRASGEIGVDAVNADPEASGCDIPNDTW
jgi:prepilin-type N-terminal cleavage/methylation domain-containing protein